ncbi:cobyric acid synthase [Bacillus weihaiensis]|uniref:Cobyric acid synthase n=1 Tax=Bacillus weihaiensis TaxID=1547283 RepID=A0A1L3MS39_9BACI|nr:cobyric acid synthase [Bacillus weihaiensis]APH05074.1 cobyric acid synthase CobQ [Bacillus weihaiensis]
MPSSQPIMFQGTHSDAGKSVIVTAFCRIFSQDGYKTAPFKSQNMALNSYITVDGKEIGRAQGVQAEAANIQATTDMNPILIKPNRENESQIVVHGKPFKNMEAGAYRRDFFDTGIQLIQQSLINLNKRYDRIVIEGAGSPAEVNLNDRELVNMRVARMANAPVVLIGDIEKGGVFASLVGTLQLLEKEDHNRVIGVIINKFRGDLSLLQPGLSWFEEYTGKKVLGVIPHLPNLNIDAEDSVILNQYTHKQNSEKEIDIAVIQYPKISNFTDLDPFTVEEDCHIRYVSSAKELKQPDLVILPGSKNTIEDLLFLKNSGLADKLESLRQKGNTFFFGICGGYQMLGSEVHDPLSIESPFVTSKGLQFVPLQTTITKEKTTTLSQGIVIFQNNRFEVKGYEIHMGITKFEGNIKPFIKKTTELDGCMSYNEKIIGTYFHGIFHNDPFRESYINHIREFKGLAPIYRRPSYVDIREEAYDRLADHVRHHVDLEYIETKMKEYQQAAT